MVGLLSMPLPSRRIPLSLYYSCCYRKDSVLALAIRRRCKSTVVSSVAVDPDKQPKRKRIARHERRAMVEAFIAKYKESNAGKFPSPYHVARMVGGNQYVIREIVQEIEYFEKLSLSDKSVQLGKANEYSKQISDIKEVSICNLNDIVEGKANGQSSDIVQLGIGDNDTEPICDVREETSISNEDEGTSVMANRTNSDAKEEPSNSNVVESTTRMLDGGRSDAKEEPLTCNVAEDKTVEVHGIIDAKEELSSCTQDKSKEDVDNIVDNGDEFLKFTRKSVEEHLMDDALSSHTRQSVAEKKSAKESDSMNSTRKNEDARSDLKELTIEPLKKPDVEDTKTSLWNNLRSVKEKIFSFWKNF